ncbi:hypothetical protein [Laribacter hongkongensis]|uniref:hypothetical protein n=1 Tax=Laribacter hongkongensis TaxID=168471 RepID=UPI0011C8C3B0|nr:hypothetical protein [Laribacter hongkongensis]MCG9041646.1 hypothetical protein [Laribacter hongkongensis]MCG9067237.1 hypothetical protein [Laribacter hongkongensis]MCG9089488.1 hypothetical protein [Laribacter hongkongensis]MCG9110442.1 hypothetical protein [Laribacter hongkongensis]MCG9122389.1 hypothetical protein [Laribacter hongkongensis]
MTSEVSSSVPLPRFWRGIAGAIVATLVLELLLRFAAPLVIGHVVRPALLVNRLLGLPPTSLAGTVVHLALALVVLPLGFVWIVERLVLWFASCPGAGVCLVAGNADRHGVAAIGRSPGFFRKPARRCFCLPGADPVLRSLCRPAGRTAINPVAV